MTISLMQAAVGGGSATPYAGLALGSPVTAGKTLLAIGSVLNGADGTSQVAISDSVNGSWPAATMGGVFNGERVFAAVLDNSAAGVATLTVSQTGPASGVRLFLFELTGTPSAAALGGSNPGTGTGTVPSISLAGVSANSALFASIAGNTTPVADPAWVDTGAGSSWNNENIQYLLDAGAAGTKSANWTPSTNWAGLVIEVKAAGGGSGGGSPETLFVPLVRRVRRGLRR